MNMSQYESVIIFTPVLSEKQMTDAVTAYKQLITDNGGSMIHEENWGLTKLAYPIQKKSTGFYYIFEFTGGNDLVSKLELAYRRDDQVMRYLTTRLDKHAIAYNQKRRSGAFDKKPEKEAAV